MPENISVWSLILEASLFVQLIMLILVAASVATWVIIYERRKFLADASAQFAEFEEQFWSGIDLTQQFRSLPAPAEDSLGQAVFRAGFREFSRLRQQTQADGETIMIAAERAMKVCISKDSIEVDKHLTLLATIGSTAPYIGLLGTVWGIMNSFLGLSDASSATLAAVAPGIAEALIATAMGLFAAIPAVMAYNRFSAQADRLVNDLETYAQELTAILHRQLQIAKPKAAPPAAQTRPAGQRVTQANPGVASQPGVPNA